MKEGVKKNHSKLDKILDGVEKLGNRVPHPAIIFLMLIVFVAVLSQIFQMMGQNATYEVFNSDSGQLESTTVHVKSLFSGEGYSLYLNFNGFKSNEFSSTWCDFSGNGRRRFCGRSRVNWCDDPQISESCS